MPQTRAKVIWSFLYKHCPLTDVAHNPFTLTRKAQKEALDYEKNLCYCYDCDLEKSNPENPKHPPESPSISHDPFVEKEEIGFSNGTLIQQKIRFYKVKSFIGLVAPKHIGGKILSYKICYKKDKCTSGKTALFGTIIKPNRTKIPINKENLVIHECLISKNSRNVYDAVQWINIHLKEVNS